MDILKACGLRKIYGSGETAVHALDGVEPYGGEGRVCGNCRHKWKWKINPFTYVRRT